MILRFTTLMLLAAFASSCRSSGDAGTGAAAPQFEKGLLVLVGETAPKGGEAVVRLRRGSSAGDLNVIIAQLEYDTERMKLKACDIADPAGKQLMSLEQTPGTVRAIVTGSPDPLPAGKDVFSCVFTVPVDAKGGATIVRIEGDIADTEFVDHTFHEEATVLVQD